MTTRMIALLTLAAAPIGAADYYVSPQGGPSGNGSINAPWDLQTALDQPKAVKPGDTIWLRGGTYYGPFLSTLSGTSGAPIIVRSYVGERVTIDCAGATALTTSLPAAGTASCVFSDARGLTDGARVLIGSEQVQVGNKSGNSFTCYRGWNGTTPAAHAAGSTATRLGNIVESAGSYVWWWGLEIMCSQTQRQVRSEYRGAGLNLSRAGVGNKAINLAVHDVGHPGIGFWDQGDGGEIYGSLIWNNGIYDPEFGDRVTLTSMRRGSAVYAENRTGTVQISDNIAFHNLTNGLHLSATNATVDGFTVTGNVVFDNSTGELFADGGSTPMKNLKMIGNIAYIRPTSLNNPARLGYDLQNDIVFQDNFIIGGDNPAVTLQNWIGSVNFTGNTIVGPDFVIAYTPSGAAVTWDRNKYYTPFVTGFGLGPAVYAFAGWQRATGFDPNGSYSSAYPQPTYFLRPNKYESGRGNLTIVNWNSSSSIQVNLSGVVTVGAAYEIRDAQNFYGSQVASGTYNGGTVTVPLTSTAVSPVKGSLSTLDASHTPSGFNSFVVLSAGASGGGSSPGPQTPSDTTAPLIQSPSVSSTLTGATITWTTNEPADTQVYYGTTSAYGNSSPLNSSKVTSHSVVLSGLTQDTQYHYQMRSRDAAGNLAAFANLTFRTAAPLLISGASAGSVTQTGATVTWNTNKSSDTQVYYGTTTSYGGSTALDSAAVMSHSAALSGLTPGTTYHYQARSRDAAGNLTVSADLTFQTLAGSLAVSNVSATSITNSSAAITWTTNLPANGQVLYGTSYTDTSSSALVASMTTSHSITLSGLRTGVTYYYRAQSRDASGKLATSADLTFKTAAAVPATSSSGAPLISEILVAGISASSASVTWTTTRPADSQVQYGTTAGYGSSTALNPAQVTRHSVTLSGLSARTTYNIQLLSRDASGSLAASPNLAFTTASY